YQKELDTLSAGLADTIGPGDWEYRKLFKTLSANSRPLINGIGINYTVPGLSGVNKVVSDALRDWQVGGFLQYASGLPFAPPAATTTPAMGNVVFQNTVMNRVPSESPFTVDLNCHCFDPN